jgi:hypothetical protein
MGEDSGRNSVDSSERAFRQLKMYIDVYKYHFDLFLKGVVLYLATVGAIAGFIYRSGASVESQVVLSAIVSIGSIIAMFGCYVSRKWVIALEEAVNNLAEQAGAERFPFSGAKGVLVVIIGTSVLFAVAGVVNLLLATVYSTKK